MEILINDEIGGWGVDATQTIEKIKNSSGVITVVIDSPGGDVFSGIQIYNALKEYDGKVEVKINSIAASIASYIAMAGDTITAMSNSTLMIHNVWTVAAGDHNALRKTADVAEGLTNLLAQTYSAKTGININKIMEMMNDETYLFGDEIISRGFADEMIKVDGETDQMAALALAKERFKACEKHVKENTDEFPMDRMAALIKEEPETVITGAIVAKRFKLTTGETI